MTHKIKIKLFDKSGDYIGFMTYYRRVWEHNNNVEYVLLEIYINFLDGNNNIGKLITSLSRIYDNLRQLTDCITNYDLEYTMSKEYNKE